MQHVATWKEGDEKWAYHEDAFAHIGTHKVSLDPYRLESRRILACIKDILPAPPIQRVEKASIDEVFLDLSAQIHSILVERYPEISGPAPYDDPTENLPCPPTTALDWCTDALVDLDNTETEDDDPDWDDITMLVGSEIVRSVRASIRERLKYTCSAGVARNKMIAKLGSGYKKPNQQTVVRNRAVQQFLTGVKFTKIRNLGGKLGDQVTSTFATDQVDELLKVPVEQLKSKLGEDTGSWVYQIIRGEERSEVNSRTQIKSMLSAKSFRPSINTFEQAVRWLRIFVADIFSRLVEEGVLENKRRPKTMNLHHRQGGTMRSRQLPIPAGKAIDEGLLFDLSKNLLGQVIVDGRAWPCANLSLSVGGFEDGPTGNRGIGGFLVRGDEAKALKPRMREEEHSISDEAAKPDKRRKVDEGGGIQKFFAKRELSREEHDDDFGATGVHQSSSSPRNREFPLEISHGSNQKHSPDHEADLPKHVDTFPTGHALIAGDASSDSPALPAVDVASPTSTPEPASLECSHCSAVLPASEMEQHEDWHLAKDLQAQSDHGSSTLAPAISYEHGGSGLGTSKRGRPKKVGGRMGRAANERDQVEKGQKRLVFGR